MAIKKPSVNITKPKASQSFATKEAIVKRLNERMASIVRNAGTRNENSIFVPGRKYSLTSSANGSISLQENPQRSQKRIESLMFTCCQLSPIFNLQYTVVMYLLDLDGTGNLYL